MTQGRTSEKPKHTRSINPKLRKVITTSIISFFNHQLAIKPLLESANQGIASIIKRIAPELEAAYCTSILDEANQDLHHIYRKLLALDYASQHISTLFDRLCTTQTILCAREHSDFVRIQVLLISNLTDISIAVKNSMIQLLNNAQAKVLSVSAKKKITQSAAWQRVKNDILSKGDDSDEEEYTEYEASENGYATDISLMM
jgi:hypothetical protein